MAWESTALDILRVVINDLGSPPTYEDCRLQKIIYVSAVQVVREVFFNNEYSVDILTETISPDPSSDSDFIVLVAAKAACILAMGELKAGANCAVRVVNGPSSIDLSPKLDGLKYSYKEICDNYDNLKRDYVSGNTIGAAILGPYAPGGNMIGY